MAKKTAAVIGSTGLIGTELTRLLKDNNDYETIRLIVRRPITDAHPKVEVKLVAFDDYESLKLAIDGCHHVYCAVGTTLKKVKGDKVAYRKADYDVPVHTARACLETGVEAFLLVSAVGAAAKSGNFYLRLKGEVEEAVQKFPIPAVGFFRPSVLLGNRNETRVAERISQTVMTTFSFALGGNLSKYKPIQASDVARAMITAAALQAKGFTVYEYEAMMNF